ncbi:ribulose-phosphate 3-epimerase-like isoform X3 [Pseudophryne corroboree]|uniref:ribulose-phosphate 3-epimerase-like isoform X3 n=1 Tax=Pseudophryne corroboree TaxID=495146 RepID=UPI0030817B4C
MCYITSLPCRPQPREHGGAAAAGEWRSCLWLAKRAVVAAFLNIGTVWRGPLRHCLGASGLITSPCMSHDSCVRKNKATGSKEERKDMHMMVAKPEQWVKPMAAAGANQYTFHLEATDNPGALIKDIRESGMKVGLGIKPNTTVEYLALWANQIDMALVMTVEPGFGGQKFMEDMMPKAGANMIVSGSAIMKSDDPRSVINLLRNTCREAAQKRSLDR